MPGNRADRQGDVRLFKNTVGRSRPEDDIAPLSSSSEVTERQHPVQRSRRSSAYERARE